MNNKIPSKIASEKSVLGSMLISKEALTKATDVLSYESFYDPKNQILFTILKDMYSDGIPIDMTTLTSYLVDKKKLNEVGGADYLSDILNTVPSARNVDKYIKEVEDASILRGLIDTSDYIKNLVSKSEDKIEDILDESERKILGVVKNRRSKEFKPVGEVLEEAQKNIAYLSDNKREITGIPTGFTDLDKLTTGLKPGQLVIIAGRPGIGKTVVATNVASNIAIKYKKTVALFNLEMSAEQLMNRILASVGQIDQYKLQTGYLGDKDWDKLSEAISKLSKTKLYFDDTPSLSIGELKSKCRRLASSEEGLDVIILDYLQILTSNKNYNGNRQQEVADISRSLKQLALELGVPIIALAQLRRPIESKKENKRPTMNELRESGQIEQDADLIILLYREDYQNPNKGEPSDVEDLELNLEKNRNGPAGQRVEVIFDKKTASLFNKAKVE